MSANITLNTTSEYKKTKPYPNIIHSGLNIKKIPKIIIIIPPIILVILEYLVVIPVISRVFIAKTKTIKHALETKLQN
jgi:hypothetical protein